MCLTTGSRGWAAREKNTSSPLTESSEVQISFYPVLKNELSFKKQKKERKMNYLRFKTEKAPPIFSSRQ